MSEAGEVKGVDGVVMPRRACYKFLSGQKAVVTGGDSGIGRAIAAAMGREGADVLVNFRKDEAAAKAVVEEIERGGTRAVSFGADVSDEQQVLRMFQFAKEQLGTFDILVNNAGVQRDAPFDQMTLEQWDQVLRVNLTGQFLCAREAVREFKARGVRPGISCAAGKIVCISSVHQTIPWAGHANYAASKGGINMMMASLAQEVAPLRIRVNSIAPGAIRTPINRPAWSMQEAYDKLMTLVPYRRIGEPEDVAEVAVWLASDAADYITGQTIFVDGGMTLYPGFATGG